MKHTNTIKLNESEWVVSPSHHQSKEIVITYKGKKVQNVTGLIIYGKL